MGLSDETKALLAKSRSIKDQKIEMMGRNKSMRELRAILEAGALSWSGGSAAEVRPPGAYTAGDLRAVITSGADWPEREPPPDPAESLPPPFDRIRRECDERVHKFTPNTASQLGSAFAFDKSLEHIVFNDTIWPIVMELTDGKPLLNSGSLVNEDHRLGGHGDRPVHLHCAREDGGPRSARFEIEGGRIYCDNFIVFPY